MGRNVSAGLFPGQKPLLSPNQQHQSTECIKLCHILDVCH